MTWIEKVTVLVDSILDSAIESKGYNPTEETEEYFADSAEAAEGFLRLANIVDKSEFLRKESTIRNAIFYGLSELEDGVTDSLYGLEGYQD